MDYSTENLQQIRSLANKLTPITEIGVLLGLNEQLLRDDIATVGHPARQAFYGGMAEQALKIRERTIELAAAGSPSADDSLKVYLRKMLNDL